MAIKGNKFTVKEEKFEFFFGRVISTERNRQRSISNLENLKKLGIDEKAGGKERLLQIFLEGLKASEVIEDRKITEYGINISRKVEISGEEQTGAIIVRYFYPNGDLDAIPEVVSLIVLIYK
jgi:hypothetical protein